MANVITQAGTQVEIYSGFLPTRYLTITDILLKKEGSLFCDRVVEFSTKLLRERDPYSNFFRAYFNLVSTLGQLIFLKKASI